VKYAEDEMLDVLDKGYVRIVDYMGDDKSIVDAARVSYDKECVLNPDGTLAVRDEKLLNFLVRENHWSVFRHATVQFEVYMPLMVARQYWKYIVGVANVSDGICMNESSRRYITEEPVFYIPDITEWRGAPENSKQGSGEVLDPRLGRIFTEELMSYINKGEELYNQALRSDVCAEQARLFLPAYGMYVRVRTTMSLAALIHFLKERLGHDAQKEIYEYAKAMRKLVEPLFPSTFKAIFND